MRARHTHPCASVLLAVVTVVTSATATPVATDRPQVAIEPSAASTSASERAIDALSIRTGTRWRVHAVNGATGTPHLAFGSGIETGAPAASGADAERLARDFIDAQADVFGTNAEHLELWQAAHASGKWGVTFHQLHRGIRVLGGRVHVTMTDAGRVFVIGSDVYPGVEVSTTPAITASAAVTLASKHLDAETRSGVQEPTLRILPVHDGGRVTHHLVWQVEQWTDDPTGHWYTYVDAHTGAIRWLQSAVYHADVTGTVRAVVEDLDFCTGAFDRPLANIRVEIDETGDFAYTDVDGAFSIPAGADPVTLRTELAGRWIDVNRSDDLESADPEQTLIATPGVPVDIVWDEPSSRWDERDVYFHGDLSHEFIVDVDPSYGDLDYQMASTVGIADACNAFYDGVGINFFQELGGCANSGRIGDVVYHEYGHGVTWYLYGAPEDQPFGRIHEGNSDVFAFLISGNALLAAGFHLDCEAGLRNADNTLCWPDDLFGGSGHTDGQMLSGFYWELRQRFVDLYGESDGIARTAQNWHFARKLGLPTDLDDQVFFAFVYDDDNGDLDDGTPHYGELCSAADAHCFPCPDFGVEIRHTAVGPLWAADTPVDVTAKVYSTLGSIPADSARVRFAIDDGPFTETEMSGSPADSLYSVALPGQPAGSTLTYYLVGADDAGNVETLPRTAPTDVFTVLVAPTVWNDFEASAAGWTSGGDATEGLWERVEPVGSYIGMNPVAVDEDHSVPGTFCFVTEQNVEGETAAENDVDGGTALLLSPAWNLSGATEAVLNYHRWYTDDSNTSPQEEYWVVEVKNGTLGAWVELENTTDSENDWVLQSFDLISLFGAPEIGLVQVRFLATDLPPTNNLVEAGVDDVWIQSDLGGGSVGVDPVHPGIPAVTRLSPILPNPAVRGTRVAYELGRPGRVRLDVYDVGGRHVRTLVNTSQAAGYYAVRWDGTGDAGSPIASGSYVVRLSVDGVDHHRKLTVVR